MSRYVSFRDFDWFLLLFVLIICTLGVIEIYSATFGTKFAGAHVKQIYWVIGGVIVMFLLSLVNYHLLLGNAHWMYLVAIVALIAVRVFGKKYLGARRWIQIGGNHFQPSEWVKLILILAVAKYFAEEKSSEASGSDIVKVGLLVGVPFLMVLAQPDLGTALTYLPVAIMGFFLGGMKAKHAVVILLLVALVIPIAWMKVLKPYQKDRLTSFVDPEADPQKAGYQVLQSLVAVGSGGLTGKGIRKGSQTQGSFLPIPQTDFIFAAFSEEHGFVGAIFLLLLYFVVLMRLIHDAQTAPDRAGTFIVMGVVAVLAFHILVNVGMVVGFMPVTGIPLPLMSYGGSSVLFMFLALGIVMNVRMRRFVN
ncbi:cell elongation-specific peptidoglycan biosynthesis regulator RodA [Candidatus Koribacter versatilis Ellin345]|uniref:Peptidoglycan glycosyltransferase RodA n=1 Tax=Koribacter versatilis (strain Ellin345) TaxID=204669 RepID=Q1IRN2_KORVE|nr:rod shape-determining protein RodA [Candidatus Koribacter versatilis]ABF40468.1 cell elongation-specific peptidoglycan biosynthesis regulator RodA [Candidatus Koribacter versatilis Ellin345]